MGYTEALVDKPEGNNLVDSPFGGDIRVAHATADLQQELLLGLCSRMQGYRFTAGLLALHAELGHYI
jgi:hypothetical protein